MWSTDRTHLSPTLLDLFGPGDSYVVRNAETLVTVLRTYTDKVEARLEGAGAEGHLILHLEGPDGFAEITSELDGHEGWKFHVTRWYAEAKPMVPRRYFPGGRIAEPIPGKRCGSWVTGDVAETAAVLAFDLDRGAVHPAPLTDPTI